MNYIVLDLEWNQCPYGKKKEDPSLPFEIVEIGAVRLNGGFEEAGVFHETVQPVLYKKLHYMTRSVIHMTEKDFEGKRTFPEVFTDFISWCGEDPVFCTWGPGDLTELQRNVRWHINRGSLDLIWPFTFPLFFSDVQKVFSLVREDGKLRRSLEWAVNDLSVEKGSSFHDAFSDALYTAQVMRRLPGESFGKYLSIDTYVTPATRRDEIFVQYDKYTKFISKSFHDRNDVMRDRVVVSTCCSLCGERAKKKIRWFSDNGKNFLCVAVCGQHGLVKGKIRIRQNGDGEWFAIKTVRPITPGEYEAVLKKQEALRAKRKFRRRAEHSCG